MGDVTAMSEDNYVFTDREQEQRRLQEQAPVIEPLTERVFRAAGLEPGMRVLDLGSGAGDVALLAARMVGPWGHVVGVERNPDAVRGARSRIEDARLTNVEVVEGDVQTLDGVGGEFDAIVGRLVLMYVKDPLATVRTALEHLRPGGLFCMNECDLTYDWAEPMTPLWEQVRGWVLSTADRAGIHTRLGLALNKVFVAAGLPPPEMRLEAAITGGSEPATWAWANLVIGLMPLMESLGIATPAEVQPSTLAQRLRDQVVAANGVSVFGNLIGAWSRRPDES